jgi:NNP family nitrate/nitrite transporter-like MFS transporter
MPGQINHYLTAANISTDRPVIVEPVAGAMITMVAFTVATIMIVMMLVPVALVTVPLMVPLLFLPAVVPPGVSFPAMFSPMVTPAFVAAPVIAQFFLLYFTWRSMPAAIGAACLLLGASFAIWGKGGNFPGKPPGAEAIRDLAATRAFWFMVLLFAAAVSSTMGLYTMLPLYLVKELEVSQGFANSLVALSRLPGVAMALAAGWATDRFGPRRTITLMLGLTGMATIGIGVCKDPGLATVLIIAQAGLSTGYFPAGFALLSAIAPARHRNVAVSLAIPLAFVYGGGIAPAIIGITGDAGSFATGIVLVGILICLGSVLPVFIKN